MLCSLPDIFAPSYQDPSRSPHRRQYQVIEIGTQQLTYHNIREELHFGFLEADNRDSLQDDDISNTYTAGTAIQAANIPEQEFVVRHGKQLGDEAEGAARGPAQHPLPDGRLPGTAPALLHSWKPTMARETPFETYH